MHRINTFGELCGTYLIRPASVYLKILYLILPRLISTELKFGVNILTLALAKSICQVVEGHLVVIIAPSMRENSVRWDIKDQVFGQAQLTMLAEL